MNGQGKSVGDRKKSSGGATSALAARLGLSRWAVSRALNGKPGVSEETVARVRAEAAKGGFAPSVLARGLRAGGTALAGICLPDPEGYALTGRLGSLARLLSEKGFDPVFQVTDGSPEEEARALGFFAGVGCRAIAIFAARLGVRHPAVAGLLSRGVKVVHIDPAKEGLGIGGVVSDRARAMALLVEYLHARGFRSACLAGIDPAGAYASQRMRGLASAAKACGWKRLPASLPTVEAPDDFSEGERLARIYMEGSHARAVIARNDRVAFGFQSALLAAGKQSPRDYFLAGYDGTPLARLARPPFATIDPGHGDLVAVAASLLAGERKARGVIKIRPKLA